MTTADDIRAQLQQLGLDFRGNKSTMKARLRKYQKKEQSSNPSNTAQSNDGDNEKEVDASLSAERLTGRKKKAQSRTADVAADDTDGCSDSPTLIEKNSRYDYMLAFDVEATCESGISFEFPNEVIEFPVVLLDGKTLEVIDEFQSYVRPVNRPKLSQFCMDLTGIQQETVDNAPTFVEVLALFEEWLTKHGIILGEYSPTKGHGIDNEHFSPSKKSKKGARKGKGGNLQLTQPDFEYGASFCFVTDGPFDIRDFIAKQCLHSRIPRPSYFTKPYLDVRTLFRDYFDLTNWLNLEGMLKFLGETFVGRQHSGICDARNVGRILKQIAQGFVDSGNEDSIFHPANDLLVATPWSEAKIAKFAGGCVLKANRQIDQTREVRMWSFEKVKRLEKRTTEQQQTTAAGSSSGANRNKEEKDEDNMAVAAESEPLKATEP
ncbi:hypothetical protein CPB97_004735 [Podila verticillata]|nr:hypothetical protein CPB97_004735 [Podila verticillata]